MLEFIGLCVCSACLSCICCLITGGLCMIPAAVGCRSNFVGKHCPRDMQWLSNFPCNASYYESSSSTCCGPDPRVCFECPRSSASPETTTQRDTRTYREEDEASRSYSWTVCTTSVDEESTTVADEAVATTDDYPRLVRCNRPVTVRKHKSRSEEKRGKSKRGVNKTSKKNRSDSFKPCYCIRVAKDPDHEASSRKTREFEEDPRPRSTTNPERCVFRRPPPIAVTSCSREPTEPQAAPLCWTKQNCRCKILAKKETPACSKKQARENFQKFYLLSRIPGRRRMLAAVALWSCVSVACLWCGFCAVCCPRIVSRIRKLSPKQFKCSRCPGGVSCTGMPNTYVSAEGVLEDREPAYIPKLLRFHRMACKSKENVSRPPRNEGEQLSQKPEEEPSGPRNDETALSYHDKTTYAAPPLTSTQASNTDGFY